MQFSPNSFKAFVLLRTQARRKSSDQFVWVCTRLCKNMKKKLFLDCFWMFILVHTHTNEQNDLQKLLSTPNGLCYCLIWTLKMIIRHQLLTRLLPSPNKHPGGTEKVNWSSLSDTFQWKMSLSYLKEKLFTALNFSFQTK